MSGKPRIGGSVLAWLVTASIRPNTVNMLEVVGLRRQIDPSRKAILGEKDFILFSTPYMGNANPKGWLEVLNSSIRAACSTIAAVTGNENIDIDGETIQKSVDAVIRGVAAKLQTAVMNADGKRVLKVEPDGAMLIVQPDEMSIEGQKKDVPAAVASPEAVEELDAIAKKVNDAGVEAGAPSKIDPPQPTGNEPPARAGRVILES